MRNRQAGLTLVETILVLLVAAIIIGGIWAAYSQINLNSQVERTVQALDETLAVTRDYLSTQLAVPTTGSPASLSPNLAGRNGTGGIIGKNLMPPELTYAYTGPSNALVNSVNDDTQVFISPLGEEFFVQYPNGIPNPNNHIPPDPTKVFEVRIGFVNSTNTINVAQCMALLPKLIGTTSAMTDRGMVGYWYGAGPTITAWLTSVIGNPTPATPTATLPPLTTNTATQLGACSSSDDIRLYFSMRP